MKVKIPTKRFFISALSSAADGAHLNIFITHAHSLQNYATVLETIFLPPPPSISKTILSSVKLSPSIQSRRND